MGPHLDLEWEIHKNKYKQACPAVLEIACDIYCIDKNISFPIPLKRGLMPYQVKTQSLQI